VARAGRGAGLAGQLTVSHRVGSFAADPLDLRFRLRAAITLSKLTAFA
jgi:hypothetical protein